MAPLSVHWEVGNAFSAMLRRQRVTLPDVLTALEAYRQARIIVRHTGQHARLEEYERAIQRLEHESSVRLSPRPLE